MLKSVAKTAACFMLLLLIGTAQSCAPRPVYRGPAPAPVARAPLPVPPAQPERQARPEPAPPVQQSIRKPLPADPKIREQSLPNTGTSSAPVLREPPVPAPEPPADPGLPLDTPDAPPTVPDDSSLLAKITASTQPRRAASLRLTEEGKKLIDAGAPAKGLPRLEQSIAIDSSNAYSYFYLAKAHHKLGRHKESLNFLDVAESRLSAEAYWLAEVYALRGENFRALGMAERAQASYLKALSINPGNRAAAEAISRPQLNPAPAPP